MLRAIPVRQGSLEGLEGSETKGGLRTLSVEGGVESDVGKGSAEDTIQNKGEGGGCGTGRKFYKGLPEGGEKAKGKGLFLLYRKRGGRGSSIANIGKGVKITRQASANELGRGGRLKKKRRRLSF